MMTELEVAAALDPHLLVPDGTDRRTFLGASEVAAVLGLAPTFDGSRQTAYDVWERKTAETPAAAMDPARALFLARRKRFEPIIVQMLREEFDAEIIAVNRRYRDPDVPHFVAEIDFEWMDETTHPSTIQNGEIKTVSPFTFGTRYGWGEPGSGDIPVHYEAQTQMGPGVRRRRVCAVAALVGFDSMVFYKVDALDEVIASMRATCGSFWVDNVLKRVPPEPQTSDDLDKLYAKPVKDKAVEATTDVARDALRLRAINATIGALEMEKEACEFTVRHAMKDAEMLVVEGRRIISWKEQRYARLDQAALKEQENVIWRRYQLRGTERVLKALKSAPAFEPGTTEGKPEGEPTS